MKYEVNKPIRPYVSSLLRNSMFVVIGLVLGLYVGSLYVVAQVQDFAVSTVKQPSVVQTTTPVTANEVVHEVVADFNTLGRAAQVSQANSIPIGVTHSTYGDLQPAETVREVQ